MTKLSLYYSIISPPSRFALILCKILGLDFEEKEIDLLSAQHLTEDYKKKNPTQTVPALVDGDVRVFDSNAIAIYLVEKYAKDDKLYPKDINIRTKVNERLFYAASFIFPRGIQLIKAAYFGGLTEIPEDKKAEIHRAYETLELFLQDSEYLACDHVTICDLSVWALLESGSQMLPLNETRFPKLIQWLSKMRESEFYELNKKGADLHIGMFFQSMERNRQEAAKKSG